MPRPAIVGIQCGVAVTAVLVVCAALGAHNGVASTGCVVPGKGPALYVDAVCGHGCKEPGGACEVFLLAESEFAEYADKAQSEIEAQGRTPLLLTNIAPGVYYVGVETAIDTSVVHPPEGSTWPARSEFFLDDLADRTECTIRSGDKVVPGFGYPLISYLRKWYRVEVDDAATAPVVGLFLERQGPYQNWEQWYPKGSAFQLTVAGSGLDEFWQTLGKAPWGISASMEERAQVMQLLPRGGKVALLKVDSPTILWVDSVGQVHARRRLAGEEGLLLSTGEAEKARNFTGTGAGQPDAQ